MPVVAEINPYNTKKVKVKLEDGFTFTLYKGEMKKYNLKDGKHISEDIYNEIVFGILVKRAKERSLYILKDSAKTKKQIMEKLKKDCYPNVVIDKTVDFLEKYNYINDHEFIINYIEKNIRKKSFYKVKKELYLKGISKAAMENILLDIEFSDDVSIRKLIDKKIKQYNLEDPKDKRKFYGLLQRNGYSYDTIQRALELMKFER